MGVPGLKALLMNCGAEVNSELGFFCLFFLQTSLFMTVYEDCCRLKNCRPSVDNNSGDILSTESIMDLKQHKPE